jgi:3-hydroxybutyrate dehydrogenase
VLVTRDNMAGLEATAEAAGGSGTDALAVRADVSVESDVQAAVGRTVAVFGRLGVLVNNAGG